ncbi:MAG TPA: hypothetical protein VIN40_03470 [Candidatus Tyrphobacter sp.]
MVEDDDLKDEFALIESEHDVHPDFGQVPRSKGVPRSLLVAVAIGIVMIFGVGAGVILTSVHGHMWPSNSTLREPLQNATVHPTP